MRRVIPVVTDSDQLPVTWFTTWPGVFTSWRWHTGWCGNERSRDSSGQDYNVLSTVVEW